MPPLTFHVHIFYEARLPPVQAYTVDVRGVRVIQVTDNSQLGHPVLLQSTKALHSRFTATISSPPPIPYFYTVEE